MGNIGVITSVGKQNVGENQNTLKLKYIELIQSGYIDKIAILVDDSVVDKQSLYNYIEQYGGLAQQISSSHPGEVGFQWRSILCCYSHHRGNVHTSYLTCEISRSYNFDENKWNNWGDIYIYSTREGSYVFSISGDFNVVDS